MRRMMVKKIIMRIMPGIYDEWGNYMECASAYQCCLLCAFTLQSIFLSHACHCYFSFQMLTNLSKYNYNF